MHERRLMKQTWPRRPNPYPDISLLPSQPMLMKTDKNNTLLLIENDADDAKLILDALDDPGANYFDVEWVGQLAEGLRLLGKGGIGLVVLDLNLPDSQGL